MNLLRRDRSISISVSTPLGLPGARSICPPHPFSPNVIGGDRGVRRRAGLLGAAIPGFFGLGARRIRRRGFTGLLLAHSAVLSANSAIQFFSAVRRGRGAGSEGYYRIIVRKSIVSDEWVFGRLRVGGAQGTHEGHPYRGERRRSVWSFRQSFRPVRQFSCFRRSEGVGGRVWGVL